MRAAKYKTNVPMAAYGRYGRRTTKNKKSCYLSNSRLSIRRKAKLVGSERFELSTYGLKEHEIPCFQRPAHGLQTHAPRNRVPCVAQNSCLKLRKGYAMTEDTLNESMEQTISACAWLIDIAQRSVDLYGWDPVILR